MVTNQNKRVFIWQCSALNPIPQFQWLQKKDCREKYLGKRGLCQVNLPIHLKISDKIM